ncbi:MAG: class I tRNA ligase family protein [Planctomycetota bacterium]
MLVLAPFTPHLAEELWERLGHDGSAAYESFPAYDEMMITEETVELAVQVNGKVRGRITAPADAEAQQIIDAALAEPNVAAAIGDKQIVKKIVIPGRLVNLVVK